jgi:hypothetical protein
MSFVRLELALGKQVELWDSNVHKALMSLLQKRRAPKGCLN